MRISRFLKDTSGNLGMMFAIGAIPLLLAGGAAIDMIRANNTQTILRGAADAAALAGATSGKVDNQALVVTTKRVFICTAGIFGLCG